MELLTSALLRTKPLWIIELLTMDVRYTIQDYNYYSTGVQSINSDSAYALSAPLHEA